MLYQIDVNKLSRDYSKQPWRKGETPNIDDWKYLYIELNLPAKEIQEYMGIKSASFNRTLRALGLNKSPEMKRAVRKDCNIRKFGSPSPFGNKEIYDAGRKKCEEIYGSTNTNAIHIKNKDDMNEEYWKKHFLKNGYFLCDECSKYHNISWGTIKKYKETFGIDAPARNTAKAEQEVLEFLNSLGLNVKLHDKEQLEGLELDFYIPDKKFAVEYDGLMFHNCYNMYTHEFYDDKGFKQISKVDKCDEKGIKLFRIYEDEWTNNNGKAVWKSTIKGYLGLNREVRSQNLKCSTISEDVIADFFSENSLMRITLPELNVGLFYRGELVFAASLSRVGYIDGGPSLYLLNHFANKKGWYVKEPLKAISDFLWNECNAFIDGIFCDRRYNTDMLDTESIEGLYFHHNSPALSYYFKSIEDGKIPSEFITKEFLKKLPVYDKTLTDEQNLFNNKYRKIYDCGDAVYRVERDPNIAEQYSSVYESV